MCFSSICNGSRTERAVNAGVFFEQLVKIIREVDMLQCVAVCCSVLQCVAVCCSVLQCVAVCCSVLQCVAVCCSVLQCVAVCCSVAVCRSVSQCVAGRWYWYSQIYIHITQINLNKQKLSEPYVYLKPVEQTLYSATVPIKKSMQCVAVCCSVLQCVAVCCSVLQYPSRKASRKSVQRQDGIDTVKYTHITILI